MSQKDNDKITLGILSLIIFAVIITETISYFKTKTFELDLFSLVVGLMIWFCFYINSQRIINNNLFKKIITISFIIIIICFLKQTFTKYNHIALIIAALPLIYSIYFRVLLLIFYKKYPIQKPIIIFASKFGSADYEGKDDGYKPTMKERFFSLLLYLGFIFLCLGCIIVIKKLDII